MGRGRSMSVSVSGGIIIFLVVFFLLQLQSELGRDFLHVGTTGWWKWRMTCSSYFSSSVFNIWEGWMILLHSVIEDNHSSISRRRLRVLTRRIPASFVLDTRGRMLPTRLRWWYRRSSTVARATRSKPPIWTSICVQYSKSLKPKMHYQADLWYIILTFATSK